MSHKVEFLPGLQVSYATTKIELYFNDLQLSTATGFVLKYAQKYMLVTCQHVLSGLNPITGQCLSKYGAIPNRATFHVAVDRTETKGRKITTSLFFKPLDVQLLSLDDQTPTWFDNKSADNQDDYAVLSLDGLVPELHVDNCRLRAIQGGRITLKKGVVKSNPIGPGDIAHFYPPTGHQVYILGYPAGISPSGIFPIWKGGSIASEPLVGLELNGHSSENVFLVDGLTRSGMSGSPVICLAKTGDVFFSDDGQKIKLLKEEPLLLGVYAGREGVTPSEADLALGRVWKVQALEKLIVSTIFKSNAQNMGAQNHR